MYYLAVFNVSAKVKKSLDVVLLFSGWDVYVLNTLNFLDPHHIFRSHDMT